MENVAKSLLIAAAILMTIIILTLLMIFWNDISSYFTAKHDAKMLEQLTEFNDKFQNYNGQTIRGNELVSIMNRIIDYNNYQSEMVGYEKIIIEIDFKNKNHIKELKYNNETGSESIFTLSSDNKIKNTATSDNAIKTIAELSSNLVSNSGIANLTDTQLQKMSANIAHIVDDEEGNSTEKEEYKKDREQLLKRILGSSNVKADDNNWIEKIKKATYQYYQYTQFKRAMFKCTNVSYDETTGRVDKMNFEVVLENNKIKFD